MDKEGNREAAKRAYSFEELIAENPESMLTPPFRGFGIVFSLSIIVAIVLFVIVILFVVVPSIHL